MNVSIQNTLAHFISDQILKQPNRVLSPQEPLISSGLIDSFNLVDLSLFVEDTFEVRIDDTELNSDTFDTLAELTELILKRKD